MTKSIELLLLLAFLICVKASDYTTQHTLNCSNIDSTWTFSQNLAYLWDIVILHDVDRYIFLALCPISISIQIIFILTFLKYKLLKNTPEDIFFALIVTQLILGVCLFSDAIYNTIYSTDGPIPASFFKFCATTGTITSIFNLAQNFYLIYFLIHVILNVRKSIKQNKFFKGKLKHFIPFILAILFNLAGWMLGWLGLSQLGICEMTQLRTSSIQLYYPILRMIYSFGFILFAAVTYRYFRKHMPESSALIKRKYEENLLITRFTIGMSIIQCFFSAAMLVLYFNCLSSSPNQQILIFATIFNLTRLVQFFYLIIVMFLYRKIGKKIKKYIRSCFAKQQDQPQLHTERLTHRELFQLLDFGLKQKILDVLQDQNKIDFLKVTQIMTILTGVRTSYREYLVKDQNPRPLKNLHYHEEACFRIDSKWIKDYQQQALILPRLSLLDGKCTIYSPQIFKRLLAQDKIQKIQQSFDLIQNSSQLYKMCQTNNEGGGRSGEFFFFSRDNKYILKTVNEQEFTTLLEQLPLFYQHFTDYPNTLICKVYGMFKITHKQIFRKYYILLMKNVSGCQNIQIRRIYDMKGSTDDRRVLKGDVDDFDQTQLPVGTGVVYKDLDFLNIEKRLYVADYFANQIRSQLKIDTNFLKDLNIIDYSLLVMVVDWEQRLAEQSFWGILQRIPSKNSPNLFYHLALIDVSQKWDLKKKSQNRWKKILGKKDTSAQQPSVYQQRFMNFIREITSTGNVQLTNKEMSDNQTQNRYSQLVEKNATPKQLNSLNRQIQLQTIRSNTEKVQKVYQIDKMNKSFSAHK